MAKKRKPRPPHWYRRYIGECPVCGKDKSYRMCVYGKRPKRPKDRFVLMSQQECYDWCDI